MYTHATGVWNLAEISMYTKRLGIMCRVCASLRYNWNLKSDRDQRVRVLLLEFGIWLRSAHTLKDLV